MIKIVFIVRHFERLRPHTERKKVMFHREVVTTEFSSCGRPTDVSTLAGYFPKETPHCYRVTLIGFSDVDFDSAYAGHHGTDNGVG